MPIFRKKQDKNDISVDDNNETTKPTCSVIDIEPIKLEKPKWTWLAFLLKLYFVPCTFGKNLLCGIFRANQQTFIDAIVAHSRCLLELYLFAAYFANVLAVNMLIMVLFGPYSYANSDEAMLGGAVLFSSILHMLLFWLPRLELESDSGLDDRFRELLDKCSRNERDRIKRKVLSNIKQRIAKMVYHLLLISFPILLCALAITSVEYFLLKRSSLLESFYEYPDDYKYPEEIVAFLQYILPFGTFPFMIFHYKSVENDIKTEASHSAMPVFRKKRLLPYPDKISTFSEDKKPAKGPTRNDKTKPTCSIFIDIEREPAKLDKPKWTWMAILMKLKLYFDPCTFGKNALCAPYNFFHANRQSFIDAIAWHYRCLLELYLFAAYSALLLALNMLIIVLIGSYSYQLDSDEALGMGIVVFILTIFHIILFWGPRFAFESDSGLNDIFEETFGKCSYHEKNQIIREVLRNTKQRIAKFVYNLLTISLAILPCSLAITLVEYFLLKRSSLLESFYEFPEGYEYPGALFGLFQTFFNLFGFVPFMLAYAKCIENDIKAQASLLGISL